MSDWLVLVVVVKWSRMILAIVMVVSGMLMHRRLVYDGYAMRRLKINGEIAHIYEGMRRDAAALATAGALMFMVAAWQARQDRMVIRSAESQQSVSAVQQAAQGTLDMDDILIVFVSATCAWVGVKRLRDKRFGEMLAAARYKLEGEKQRASSAL